MKKTNLPSPSPSLRVWAAAVTACLLGGSGAWATPYATCLTNQAGVVSFRLNEDAPMVAIIGNSGSLSNYLGAVARGLTVTNLAGTGMTDGAFQVVVSKPGSGAMALIGSSIPFNSPRGVTVNANPASPVFGRVYVANSSSGTKGDGIFIFDSDLSDTFGQGDTPRTAGLSFGGSSSPYRIKVGADDDQLYICDWSDATGNLYVTDPDVTTSGYALKQLSGSAAIPVGMDNNHGSLEAVEVTGRLADGNMKIYTLDEDYQDDPTTSIQYQMNSLWEYDVSSGPLPWGNAPVMRLMTPTVNFVSQTMDLGMGPNGYFYVSDNRYYGNEAGVFVVDSYGVQWFNSRDESLAEGYSADVLGNTGALAISPDGKYLAVVSLNNVITVVPLTNGIPNLSQRFQYTSFGTTGNARGLAFDRADNLYMVSSGLGILQPLSLGFTATTISGSDGTFSMEVPSAEVSVTADRDTLFEATPSLGATLTVTRTNTSLTDPLVLNFRLSGTGVRNVDYVVQTNGVTITNATAVIIPAGSESVDVTIAPLQNTVSDLTRTAIFTLAGGGSYNSVTPNTVTLAIVDNNNTPMIDIAAVSTTMFEQNTNDYARFRLTRRGDTNASVTVNLAYSGNAAPNVDFTPVDTLTIDPGVVNQNVDIHPVDNSTVDVARTLEVAVAAGTGYLVGTNSPSPVSASIVDDDVPTETVLWQDDFNTDSSANWTMRFASEDGAGDSDYTFAYDYSWDGIPPAPHSGTDTHGLKMTVNKNTHAAAGINFYPNGQTFSGNFALRFDMFLIEGNGSYTTEYALMGINHSGNLVNWFRNSGNGYTNSAYDGLWANVEADGAGLGDYVLNTAPAVDANGVWSPTAVASQSAANLTQTFKVPPWSAVGAPANLDTIPFFDTPSWAEVELSQISGIVTLKINNTVILSYSNATEFASGNIMLGYDDAYDSIGPLGAGVVYDNVRVVELGPLQISGISTVSTNAVINFSFSENDPPSAFKIQSATSLTGPYTDATATITQPSPLNYEATVGMNGPVRFYRVRHQ